ncbi:phage scaffolding protein [Clostridium saccharoperbutylacetonicum]|uniref:phage scaffolding protein n=1 Tax=Clostridium saccharoperbutylacetonicum TaxID=36745 RepID=UPI000983DDD1|nr:phage scaffolding protein [Clostridium saccharoperbutylacetonicum]AQR95557.1 phage minor structural protein GP20 [Clostridium saccharoperbutylacetonicum]NSB31417.1 vacuolar-type H+-ATPase subunit I/STV1 [Clostridium saccharoperbutylacetonicum]
MSKLKEIIGEQAYNALPEDKKKEYDNVDLVNGAEHVAKKDYETAQATIEQQKKDIEKRDTDIKNIKAKVKDNEELTKEIDILTKANKDDRESFEKKLNEITFNNALGKALGSYNVKDKDLILAKLNLENLKVDGENIIGLKEQIEPLQKSHEYLFEKVINGTGGFGTGGGDDTRDTSKNENIASKLGKQRAEASKTKNILDFAK